MGQYDVVTEIIFTANGEFTIFYETAHFHFFMRDCYMPSKMVCTEEGFFALIALVIALTKVDFLERMLGLASI